MEKRIKRNMRRLGFFGGGEGGVDEVLGGGRLFVSFAFNFSSGNLSFKPKLNLIYSLNLHNVFMMKEKKRPNTFGTHIFFPKMQSVII